MVYNFSCSSRVIIIAKFQYSKQFYKKFAKNEQAQEEWKI